MGNAGLWAIYAVPVALVAAPAVVSYLGGWTPWQIVGLAGALAVGLGAAAWAWVWHAVQVRRIELTALSSDEQAARLLGEALARGRPFLQPAHAREVWETFAALPSEAKRAMALAVTGQLAGSGDDLRMNDGLTAVGIARGFRPRPDDAAPAGRVIRSVEEAEQVLAAALGRCGLSLSESADREVWAAFAALPREGKAWLALTVEAFVASGPPSDPGLSSLLAARARSALDTFPPAAPEPVTAP